MLIKAKEEVSLTKVDEERDRAVLERLETCRIKKTVC